MNLLVRKFEEENRDSQVTREITDQLERWGEVLRQVPQFEMKGSIIEVLEEAFDIYSDPELSAGHARQGVETATTTLAKQMRGFLRSRAKDFGERLDKRVAWGFQPDIVLKMKVALDAFAARLNDHDNTWSDPEDFNPTIEAFNLTTLSFKNAVIEQNSRGVRHRASRGIPPAEQSKEAAPQRIAMVAHWKTLLGWSS